MGRQYLIIVFVGLCLSYKSVMALEFQPTIGIGTEYTDNANLTPSDEIDDIIATGYLGAGLSENVGPLRYDLTSSISRQISTKDTRRDESYLFVAGEFDWEIIEERLKWYMVEDFEQRTIISLNTNAPDNLQDSNRFVTGLELTVPVAQRQTIKLVPEVSQYYYEASPIDNRQYSLAASWNYQILRLLSLEFLVSGRRLDYFDRSISDIIFTDYALVLNGKRVSTDLTITLGSTTVKRDLDEDSTGFAGGFNWQQVLSTRSEFSLSGSTGLTDTSRISDEDDVQLTLDVVRDSFVTAAYLRDDTALYSNIFVEYRELNYSDSPLDRTVRTFGAELEYPVAPSLSGGVYLSLNRSLQLDTGREDKTFIFGTNVDYRLTNNLRGVVDVRYRTKESTVASQNFNEFSVFANFIYGFGDIARPSGSGISTSF